MCCEEAGESTRDVCSRRRAEQLARTCVGAALCCEEASESTGDVCRLRRPLRSTRLLLQGGIGVKLKCFEVMEHHFQHPVQALHLCFGQPLETALE